ncbi:MAG: MarR family transcriptional regulator [SAR324 cluster bacterium]|nr:MarR family transcriptional regulator [SAR324 cluster bacterium]
MKNKFKHTGSNQNSKKKQIVRLWLGLLKNSGKIERHLRTKLHKNFGITITQFDLLSVLDQANEALTKSELSEKMIVTNGNVTWLVNKMVLAGIVVHTRSPVDGRVQLVQLTDKGSDFFQKMVAEHESWLCNLLQDLEIAEINQLVNSLNRLKEVLQNTVKLNSGS